MLDDGELLTAAIDLIPESFAIDILADARNEGFSSISFTAASTGLNRSTIERVLATVTTREDDPTWQRLGTAAQLDACFPERNGIGCWDLLDELGLTTVYVKHDRPVPDP